MTTELPVPLVPGEVDLRDFGFMPLDVLRLRDSDLAALATGDEFKAAVLLWCVAWHQVPAGSLPDDDRLLARYSGAGPAWKRVKDEALRGFIKCMDGRLYHQVIAPKAMESWAKKQAQRDRTKAATEAREQKRRAAEISRDDQRDGQRNVERDDQRGVARDVVQGTVKGQGEGDKEEKTSSSSSAEPTSQGGEGSEKQKPTIPCPYDAIVALYHGALPTLPRVRLMPATRQKALRKVWGWVLSSTKTDGTRRAETAEQALAWLRGYFERAAANDFLMGRSGRSAEHANWTPDLDFLLTDKGMKHVIEKTLDAA